MTFIIKNKAFPGQGKLCLWETNVLPHETATEKDKRNYLIANLTSLPASQQRQVQAANPQQLVEHLRANGLLIDASKECQRFLDHYTFCFQGKAGSGGLSVLYDVKSKGMTALEREIAQRNRLVLRDLIWHGALRDRTIHGAKGDLTDSMIDLFIAFLEVYGVAPDINNVLTFFSDCWDCYGLAPRLERPDVMEKQFSFANRKLREDGTPLWNAVSQGRILAMRKLLELGALIAPPSFDPAFAPHQHCRLNALQLALTVDRPDEFVEPLIAAARNESRIWQRDLINEPDHLGRTPLAIAVFNNRAHVERLLAAGARLVKPHRARILEFVVKNGMVDMLRLLLDKTGRTPFTASVLLRDVRRDAPPGSRRAFEALLLSPVEQVLITTGVNCHEKTHQVIEFLEQGHPAPDLRLLLASWQK